MYINYIYCCFVLVNFQSLSSLFKPCAFQLAGFLGFELGEATLEQRRKRLQQLSRWEVRGLVGLTPRECAKWQVKDAESGSLTIIEYIPSDPSRSTFGYTMMATDLVYMVILY